MPIKNVKLTINNDIFLCLCTITGSSGSSENLFPTLSPSTLEHLDRKSSDPVRTKMICQRMASDSDLWLSVKAAQAKYQSSLKESPTRLVVNHVDMPSLPENPKEMSSGRSPTPSGQRVLNQDEFDK
jgi:hypothetical protein